ncbi:MAG: WG repeat-containing protein [Proteobacteria bacterium]|nr:WG repeat-containing protein [Pseudomonadota bacterium]
MRGFRYASPFVDGLAQVESDEGVGFIDSDGKVVVPLQFDHALLRFSRDRTVAVADGKAWLIDTTGRRIADLGPWEWPGLRPEESFGDLAQFVGLDDFFADGLIPWPRGDQWGYIDRDGQWVIEPRFEPAQLFHGGYASVTSGGRGQLIDRRGAWYATSAPVDRSAGQRTDAVGSAMRWGFLTPDGDWPAALSFATLRGFRRHALRRQPSP